MANTVMTKGNEIWIEDEAGKKISQVYHSLEKHSIKATKNLLEFIVKPFIRPKKIIIDINTGKELLCTSNQFAMRNITIYDDVYRNYEDKLLYDYKGNLLVKNVLWVNDLTPNKLLITYGYGFSNDKFAYICNGICKISDIDQWHYIDKKLFIIKAGSLYVFNEENEDSSIIKLSEIDNCRIDLKEYPGNVAIFHIAYYDKEDNFKKYELRSATDPKKFVELNFCPYERYYDHEIKDYTLSKTEVHITNSKKLYLLIKSNNCYKILNLESWKLLDECDFSYYSTLNACNGKTYIVLKNDKSVKVFNENLDFVFEKQISGIKLSETRDYFILENMDFKGLATLNGKILIEPNAIRLYEQMEAFVYQTLSSPEYITLRKNPEHLLE